MATINNGDVLTDIIYNPTGNPRFTQPDRSDVDDWGVVDLVTDDNLAPEPGNIKSNFYGWFDRLELVATSGRILSFNETRVRKSDNTIGLLAGGNVVIPANTSQYVYATDNPTLAVVSGPTLPNVCAPLAWVTTNATSVVAIQDLRDQTCETIRVVTLPSVQSPWSAGDTKESFRSIPEPGWLLCDGRSLSKLDYPILFAAIGYIHGGSGNNFNIPDTRGRVLVGGGTGPGLTSRVVGAKGGLEQVKLVVTEMPAHSHSVNTSPHTHSIEVDDHSHDAIASPHSHGTIENPHNHVSNDYHRAALEGAGGGNVQSGGAEISSAGSVQDQPLARMINSAVTGLAIVAALANTTIRSAKVRATAQSATQSVSVNPQGGNGSHENMMPFIVGNRFIRVI